MPIKILFWCHHNTTTGLHGLVPTPEEKIQLNTEYAKMHAPRPATEDAELQVAEERLEEVLTNLKIICCFVFYTN